MRNKYKKGEKYIVYDSSVNDSSLCHRLVNWHISNGFLSSAYNNDMLFFVLEPKPQNYTKLQDYLSRGKIFQIKKNHNFTCNSFWELIGKCNFYQHLVMHDRQLSLSLICGGL